MISTYFSIKILSDVFVLFLAVILVPELFKKLRETPGNNFHQVSSKSDKFRPWKIRKSHIKYFKTLNNRPWGANNESLGGPGGPGTGFCSPGGGFSGSRRSGKPLRLLRLKKPPPGLQKPVPGPPGPPRDSLLAPQGRLLSVLK